MKRKMMILLCLILFVVSIAGVSAADDLNQTNDNNALSLSADDDIVASRDGGTFTDLQNKINTAPEGSTITLENNYMYVEAVDSHYESDPFFEDEFVDDDISTSYPVIIDKPLTINGNGFTIDGNYLSQIFQIETEGTVVLNNINFINAFSDSRGGSIESLGNLVVNSCNFIGSSTKIYAGGAIFVEGNLEVNNCNFQDNIAGNIDEPFGAIGDFGGGAIFVRGHLDAQKSTFISNHAMVGDVAAVYVEGVSNIRDCSFENNDDGVLYIEGELTLTDSSFSDNSGDPYAAIGGYESTMSISGCRFYNNYIFNHGSIVSGADELTIRGCEFVNNSCEQGGCIIEANENTRIYDTIFINNSVDGPYSEDAKAQNVKILYPSSIDVWKTVFTPGEKIKIDVSLNEGATGEVTIELKGITETLRLNDASASLEMDSFALGTYDLTVKYSGDDSFVPSTKSVTVKVVESTFRDLRRLIDNAGYGDTIELDRNYTFDKSIGYSYSENINVRINGNGFTLDGNDEGTLFFFYDSKIIFDNVTFENANDMMYFENCDLTFANSRFINNQDLIFGNGRVTILNCSFDNNYEHIIQVGGDTTIKGCSFTGNDGGVMNAAINVHGDLTLSDCTFQDNTVGTFISQALVNVRGDLNAFNCSFTNNGGERASVGCIHADGNSQITQCTFINNSAEYGAGIEIAGNSTVSDCRFENNFAHDAGGAIYGYYGDKLIVKNCLFVNNYVAPKYYGDAINSNFNLELIDCTFIRNGDDNSERTYGGVSGNLLSDKNVVVCEDDLKISGCGLIENRAVINVYAPDVTKYYGGSERFVVTLKNSRGNPIANGEVKIRINGVDYVRTTNSKGMASMALGLPCKVYDVTTTCGDAVVKSKVTIKDTVFADDFTKWFKNETQYYGTFIDTLGRPLAANSPVEININGVFYTRYTNDMGVARMNINLNPGTYVLTAKNPATGEMQATTIKVLGTIVENHDLTKYYKNDSQYSIRLLGGDGNPVGAGVSVRFNINGVFYTRTSDDEGYVRMNINLEPGEYIITADYNGLMASNKIRVLSVIESHDLTMVYNDGSKFEVRILDGRGSPLPNVNVTFNINGVFYEKVTDDEGVARLAINLMAGEYIITSTYNGMNAADKVTISS